MKDHDSLLTKLKEMIYSDFRPGDRLPTEYELMEKFGVGRSTIRENLKVLFAMGLIVRKGTGTCVVEDTMGCLVEPFNMIISLNRGDVEYLIELREGLELYILTLAMERIQDADILKLDRLLWKMQNPDFCPDEFWKNDIEFHNAIAESTGNPVLVEMLSAIRQVLITNNHKQANVDLVTREETVAAHRGILDALKARDLRRGKQCLRRHLRISKQVFWDPNFSQFDKVDLHASFKEEEE